MYKLLIIGFLITIVSCKQNTVDDRQITVSKTMSHIDSTKKVDIPDKETRRTETFNERIETIPITIKPFIPSGYFVINLSSGDANLDGLEDKILVLQKESKPTITDHTEEEQERRPLLLLLARTDGTFKLAYRNDNAVYCLGCGGAFGDPFTGITIKKGYFSVEHGQSGGQHWEQVTTFKYDKAKTNWFLYKDHYVSYKFNDSNDDNAEALVVDLDKLETVKDFGIIPFSAFDIYEDKD